MISQDSSFDEYHMAEPSRSCAAVKALTSAAKSAFGLHRVLKSS
jgi:hypothetical protein